MIIKRAIVNGLEHLCGLLDRTPGLCRTDTESWLSVRPRRHSDLGCALGLAMLAVRLDDRWGTGHWGNPRYATKGDEG